MLRIILRGNGRVESGVKENSVTVARGSRWNVSTDVDGGDDDGMMLYLVMVQVTVEDRNG